MNAVGITGGIGAGKTASARLLVALGFPLLDTDQVARDVVAPGSAGLEAVIRAFGRGFMNADGGLDRAAMAARVFSDPAARDELERILHPLIQQRWQAWLELQRAGKSTVWFVVIPLLFEKDYLSHFGHIVAIGCSRTTQIARMKARGWDDKQVAARLGAQLPMEEKLRRAHEVVWNDGDITCLGDQWRILLNRWS
jgi:dephospho-CoA kinase